METLILNVRVNKDDKKNFEKFCNDVGMNASTAINLFIKDVLREKRLPFEITTNNYKDEIYDKLKESDMELAEDGEFHTREDFEEKINKIIGK